MDRIAVPIVWENANIRQNNSVSGVTIKDTGVEHGSALCKISMLPLYSCPPLKLLFLWNISFPEGHFSWYLLP